MPNNFGAQAQNYARKELQKRHRKEWDEIYRAEMVRLGGKPKPTTEEKILLLKEKINELQKEIE